jgi:chemotaxis protein MotB
MSGNSVRRNRRKFDSHVSHERWLVSYADFMTLLFAFFVTMYAISNVDKRKLSDMVESMQTAFDARRNVPHNSPRDPKEIKDAPKADPGSLDDLQQQLAERLRSQIAGGLVGLEIDPRGLVITIREAGTFGTGRADLSDGARTVLAEVASALVSIPNPVRVEGHTDDVPIHTDRFHSNWELSTARATTVVAFLVQERGMQPFRMSAAGYGEFHPRAKNTDDAARSQNRRVDIIILNDTTRRAEEPDAVPGAAPGAAKPGTPTSALSPAASAVEPRESSPPSRRAAQRDAAAGIAAALSAAQNAASAPAPTGGEPAAVPAVPSHEPTGAQAPPR